MIYIEIAVLLLLIVANGIFALSELAVISARRGRLEDRAEAGDRGAQAALRLADSSAEFLATVQIGITLIGILAGVFGGAAVGDELASVLSQTEIIGDAAEEISVAIIVVALTYLSLVIGELVPKRLALRDPERLAVAVAPTMERISRGARPLVRALSGSTDLVLRLLRVRDPHEPAVTAEDVNSLLEQGAQGGVFMAIEQDLVERALSLRNEPVRSIMTRRSEIVWLDATAGDDELRRLLTESPFSRIPVGEGNADDIVGIVHLSDLVRQMFAGEPLDVTAAMREPLFVPEHATLIDAMRALGEHRADLALVVDEYGGVEGLVTTHDLLTAMLGGAFDIDDDEPSGVQRDDGSWLIDGRMELDEAAALLGIDLPESPDATTVGGFAMARLGRVPSPAETFAFAGYRFEVVDMDGHRVDKILATRDATHET